MVFEEFLVVKMEEWEMEEMEEMEMEEMSIYFDNILIILIRDEVVLMKNVSFCDVRMEFKGIYLMEFDEKSMKMKMK